MLYSTAIITLLCGYAAAADTTRPTNHPLEVVSDIFLKQDDTGAANEAHLLDSGKCDDCLQRS